MGDRVINVGDVFPSNNGGEFIVLSIKNYRCVTIEFMDSYKFRITTDGYSIKKGTVKNPYAPTVYGKGYIGFGDFKPKDYPKLYKKWKRILERCYCPKRQKHEACYRNCEVSADWLNFQNFAKWADNQPKHMLSFEIDKDLLGGETKEYSANTCCFLPQEINAAITDRSTSLIGRDKNGRYTYEYRSQGLKKKVMTFDSRAELEGFYIKSRRNRLIDLAEKWSGQIDLRVYKAIKEFEVCI